MSDTVTIVEFLTARLDEDEQAARPASGPEWEATDETGHAWRFDAAGVYAVDENQAESRWALVAPAQHQANRVHIARHDPARVLAEVAAKRRTVRWLHHQPETGIRHGDEEYVSCVCGWDRVLQGVLDWDDEYNVHLAEQGVNGQMAETMLRLLALPYGSHPDYQESWKP